MVVLMLVPVIVIVGMCVAVIVIVGMPVAVIVLVVRVLEAWSNGYL
jgi:hypothetical protein